MSHGHQSPSSNVLLALLESERDSLHDFLHSTLTLDDSFDLFAASSSVEPRSGGSLVERRTTAPAPSGAVHTAGGTSGVLEFTTASAVSAHSKLAMSGEFALADNLFGFSLDNSLLDSFASSAVELGLVSLLVKSGSSAPAPLRAELFGWAS